MNQHPPLMAWRVQWSLPDARTSGATIERQTDEKNSMKFNTHLHTTVATALCVLSLAPALVLAGSTTKPLKERGIIKSVDPTAHTLVVTEHKNHADQTFQWNDQTKFRERDKTVSANALKPSERVHLMYTAGGSAPTLQAIHIAPMRTAKHTARNMSHAGSKGA
jgi:hypothetical protein